MRGPERRRVFQMSRLLERPAPPRNIATPGSSDLLRTSLSEYGLEMTTTPRPTGSSAAISPPTSGTILSAARCRSFPGRPHSLQGEIPMLSIRWIRQAHPLSQPALRSWRVRMQVQEARQRCSIPRRCGSAAEKSSWRAFSPTTIVAWSGRWRGFSGGER